MEKLLAPLFPAGILGTFSHSLGRIFGIFLGIFGIILGIFGIFWGFCESKPILGFPPRFFKDFPPKSRIKSHFSNPQIPFFNTSDNPTKFPEQILGWDKNKKNPKPRMRNFPPGSQNPKNSQIPGAAPGAGADFCSIPDFFNGKNSFFPQTPAWKNPIFYTSPGISSFLCRKPPGMWSREGIPSWDLPPSPFSHIFLRKS